MSVLFQQHLSKFNTLLSNISAFSVKFEQHLIQHNYRYYLSITMQKLQLITKILSI